MQAPVSRKYHAFILDRIALAPQQGLDVTSAAYARLQLGATLLLNADVRLSPKLRPDLDSTPYRHQLLVGS